MFAGSCIGVILLVISLEMLRRLQRTYERYLVRQAKVLRASVERSEHGHNPSNASSASSNTVNKDPYDVNTHGAPLMGQSTTTAFASRHFRLSLPQQTLRALMHMTQFGVAYFIMLLAMYYNGYFIICILIGAFLGFFAFAWDTASSTVR